MKVNARASVTCIGDGHDGSRSGQRSVHAGGGLASSKVIECAVGHYTITHQCVERALKMVYQTVHVDTNGVQNQL